MSESYWVTCIDKDRNYPISLVYEVDTELPTAMDIADIDKKYSRVIFMQKLHKDQKKLQNQWNSEINALKGETHD